MASDATPKPRTTPPLAYAAVAVLSAILGFGAVYAILAPPDSSTRPQSMSPEPVATGGVPVNAAPALTGSPVRPSSLATGEMLTFVYRKTPEPMPTFTFEDGGGAKRTLDDFRGKVVLLNLWATWCAPCRKEMPSLDRLQATLGGPNFEVVALSVDRQGAPASRKFLAETNVANLALYVESTSKSLATLKVTGLPTTILIDREGREVGRLAGPAEWDSPDARRLIEATLGNP